MYRATSTRNLLPDSSQEKIHAEVVAMLEAFGPDKLLANLGEGLGGKEDQGLVDFFVNDIHATSEKMISG